MPLTEAERARKREWHAKNLAKTREAKRRERAENPEKVRARERARYARNPAKFKAQVRKYRATAAGKEAKRRSVLKQYGLTIETWDALLAAQGGVCACCGKEPAPSKRKHKWHTDHDHATGAVRGILCHLCNVMLGYARDDQSILIAAAAYLERSRAD